MIHQPDTQELVRRQLLAQSIADEPLPSGYYHDYNKEGEDLIDLEVEGSVVEQPPATPLSLAETNASEPAIEDTLSEKTASPNRFQQDNESNGTIPEAVYDSIRE